MNLDVLVFGWTITRNHFVYESLIGNEASHA